MKQSGYAVAAVALALALISTASTAWLRLAPGHGMLTCPSGTSAMQRLELVFGLSRKGRTDVSDAEWAQFLDREVSPRFPEGLTVLDANGQWRNSSGVVIKEPARVLLVWVKPTAELDARITAVREAWKASQQQESVLRADGASCVSF